MRRLKCLLWPHGWLYDGNFRHCIHCGEDQVYIPAADGWYTLHIRNGRYALR